MHFYMRMCEALNEKIRPWPKRGWISVHSVLLLWIGEILTLISIESFANTRKYRYKFCWWSTIKSWSFFFSRIQMVTSSWLQIIDMKIPNFLTIILCWNVFKSIFLSLQRIWMQTMSMHIAQTPTNICKRLKNVSKHCQSTWHRIAQIPVGVEMFLS